MISPYTFFFKFIYLFLAVLGLRFCARALIAASGGHSSSPCAGLSLSRPLLLQSTSSRRAGSVVVAHGPSCSAACGIFPDQGSNPCPLRWQADSQPLHHQGSPLLVLLISIVSVWCSPFFIPDINNSCIFFLVISLLGIYQLLNSFLIANFWFCWYFLFAQFLFHCVKM